MQYLSVRFECYDPSCYGELISILAERDSVCDFKPPYLSDFRRSFSVTLTFESEHKFTVFYAYNEPIDFLIGYRVVRILIGLVRKISGNKCKFVNVCSCD